MADQEVDGKIVVKAKLLLVWTTIYNWRELWFWPLVAFGNLELLFYVVYRTTGHWPQESMDALVGIGINLLLVMLAISATAIFRESISHWWTKAEAASNPHIIWSSMVGNVLVFATIVWALKH